MAEPARHLHAVDPATGEITCEGCLARDDDIAGLKTESRGWRTRYQNLVRDKRKEAEAHQAFPSIHALFHEWQLLCNHERSKWTAERFWQAFPIFDEYGEQFCRLCIAGAAYDPSTRRRKNGTIERYNSWELIWRNADKAESFAERAPDSIRESLRCFYEPTGEIES